MPNIIIRKTLLALSAAVIVSTTAIASHADTINYIYNDLNQLIRVEYADGTKIIYDYDEVGNRLRNKVVRNAHTLMVQKAGTGAAWGTITASPEWINCGTHCSEEYNHGDAVTLIATPSASATFTGWSGCSGTGACLVSMTTNTTITATFQCPTLPVKIGSSYYASVSAAYAAAGDGANIQSKNTTINDSLTTSRPINVTLDGGYDDCFSAKTGSTTMRGQIITNYGTLTVKDIIISQ